MLDILVQPRRDRHAATRFFRKLLKGQASEPRRLATDKPGSYGAARRALAYASAAGSCLLLWLAGCSVGGTAFAQCNETAIDAMRAALEESLGRARDGDFEGWLLTLGPRERAGSEAALSQWFEMTGVMADDLSAIYLGDSGVEVDTSATQGETCWFYPLKDGLRLDAAAVLVPDGDGWSVSDYDHQAPFLHRGPVVNGISLSIRTRGNQRVFRGVQPDQLMVKYVRAPEIQEQLPGDAYPPSFVAIPVASESQPAGQEFDPVPGSEGRFDRVPVVEALGHSLPVGVYEIVAFYESHAEGWWQGRLESNRLIIEIQEEPSG